MKKIFIHRKIEIIIIMIISIALGIIYATNKVPEYISSSSLIIKQKYIEIDKKTISTYNALLQSNNTIKTLKTNVDINLTETQIKEKINLKEISKSNMIEISTTDTNATRAYNINKEITNIFINKIQEIYTIEDIHIVDESEIPTETSNINYIRDIAVFVIAGIVISIVTIIILQIFDKKATSTKIIEKNTKLTVLNKIPKCKNQEQINQSFRELKNTIRVINKNLKSILITGAGQGEGKSWISSNLAVSLAKTGKNVIVIDINLKRGKQYKFFEVSSKPGLSNYLIDTSKNKDVNIINYIKETKIKNLCVLPAGDIAVNSLELLISDNMSELLEELKKMFDILIIDGTSSLNIKDSLVISKKVEATIVIAEYDKTKIDSINRTKKKIELVGGNIIGVVINKTPISKRKYVDSYFYNSPTGKREKQPGRHAVQNTKTEKQKNEIKQTKQIKHGRIKEDVFETDNFLEDKLEDKENVLEEIKKNQEKIKKEIAEKKEKTEKDNKIAEILKNNNITNRQLKEKTNTIDKKEEMKVKNKKENSKTKNETKKQKINYSKEKTKEVNNQKDVTKKTKRTDNPRAAEMLEQINEYLRTEREKNK